LDWLKIGQRTAPAIRPATPASLLRIRLPTPTAGVLPMGASTSARVDSRSRSADSSSAGSDNDNNRPPLPPQKAGHSPASHAGRGLAPHPAGATGHNRQGQIRLIIWRYTCTQFALLVIH